MLLVSALLLAQQGTLEPIAAASEALVGKPAPAMSLELVSEKRFNLGEQKGKVVFLAFWATWCEPCRRDIPRLLDAQAEFSRDLVVVGVSTEPAADVRRFLEQEHLDFASAVDRDQRVSKAYGIDLVPRLFVVDQKGVIVRMIRGLPSEGAIRRALEPLLPAPGASPQNY
jgi:peroxiredoxin